jgi:hypothetical protein
VSKPSKCDCHACEQRRRRQISPITARVPGTKPVREIDERDPAVVAVQMRQAEDDVA